MHGDYRPGNLTFGPDGTVRAVFDWELATTGDPMADLGWLAQADERAGTGVRLAEAARDALRDTW